MRFIQAVIRYLQDQAVGGPSFSKTSNDLLNDLDLLQMSRPPQMWPICRTGPGQRRPLLSDISSQRLLLLMAPRRRTPRGVVLFSVIETQASNRASQRIVVVSFCVRAVAGPNIYLKFRPSFDMGIPSHLSHYS